MLFVREVRPFGSRLSGSVMVRSSHIGPLEPGKKSAGVTAEPAKRIGFSLKATCPLPKPTLSCALSAADGRERSVNVWVIVEEKSFTVIAPCLKCTLPVRKGWGVDDDEGGSLPVDAGYPADAGYRIRTIPNTRGHPLA
jgi:hypothetical protein